jgi:hypothetical protein
MARRTISAGVKWPGHESDHSLPPSAAVNNAWVNTSSWHGAHGTALPLFTLPGQTCIRCSSFQWGVCLTRVDVLWPSDLKCCSRIGIFDVFVRPVILRHALPSTRRQASWVRVPLRPWRCALDFSVCVVLYRLKGCKTDPQSKAPY